MTSTHERTFLIEIANRLASRFAASSTVAEKLSNWVEATDLGFGWEPEHDHRPRRGVAVAIWRELKSKLASAAARRGGGRPDALERNAKALAAHVGLNEDETLIFRLAVRAAQIGPLKSLCDNLTDDAGLPVEDAVMHLTGLTSSRVRKALSPSARLMVTGLLSRERQTFHGLGLVPSDRLLAALEPPSRGLHDTLDRLFTAPGPAEVTWDDFDHFGAARSFALRLLDGALKQREAGVNILFHGAPGTGKTEFCKVLAAQLEARLHAVGECDDEGDEPSRRERLQQLRLGQRLLADQGRSLILFDEMEDLFAPAMVLGFGRSSGSKVHLNRLLDGNPVPTLWTTNDISSCDPAFLRRITYTLELRTPSAPIRARVWQRLAGKHGISLDQDLARDLAHSFAEAPALADSALRAARIAGGSSKEVKFAVTALSRAVRGGQGPRPSGTLDLPEFDLSMVQADHDLRGLVDRLVSTGSPAGATMCLSGAPGTGKSAFARYLADRLGMPVLEKRASDLLDRYVGGSERNIADAFAEARDNEAFLIFDEADSLIGARSGAVHRWEISQVNEMLTWIENHPLPLACTTNLSESLDPAALRRFSLRVTFLPLDEDQRVESFRRFFGVDATPSNLAALDLLTPGDFAVVARRVRLLGIEEPGAILRELAREQASKPDAPRLVGFQAA
jgi:SpoVK/Ycf46/Vps4 family AAA+-type ATPase